MKFKNAIAIVNCKIATAILIEGKTSFEVEITWSLVVCSYDSGTGQLSYKLL